MPFLICYTALAFSLSLISTYVVQALLTDRVSLLGEHIGLEMTMNPGVAFGITFPPLLQSVLIGIALLVVCGMAYRARSRWVPSLAFGLIIGGALANIVDRLHDGYVTDFVQIGWWPSFNIADSFITVGVGVLLWWEWKKSPR